MPTPRDKILSVVADVLNPLIQADGGEVYVVSAGDEAIQLHLAGRFAGCPGNSLTSRHVIEPAIRAVVPDARVTVTWGLLVPDGAKTAEEARDG
jgi:Fe-S cluster biogenesis protein NfuA